MIMLWRTGHIMFLAVALLAVSLPASAAEFSLDGGRVRLKKSMRSLQEIRQGTTIRQQWDNSCGSGALSTLLTYHYGDKVSEAAIAKSLLQRTDPLKVRARGGFSLLDLKRFVESRGYEGKGYAGLSLEELEGLGLPAIVPVNINGYDHFVVFRGTSGDRVVLSDPAFGSATMRKGRFMEIWNRGIGFVVISRGSSPSVAGLEPRPQEVLIPDNSASARAIMRISPAPLLRKGF